MELGPLAAAAAALGLGSLALRRLLTRFLEQRIAAHVPAARLRPELDLGPRDAGTLVVSIHGTACDASTMLYLAGALARDGARVWQFEYPYTRPIPENTRHLAEAVAARLAAPGTAPPARIVLVGYSQGGILARALASGPGGPPWLERVVGLVQLASPNLGTPPARLARLAWGGFRSRGRCFPAIHQMIPGSPLLRMLAARPLAPGVGLGVIHGLGPGRALIERFLYGDTADRAWVFALGALYEWLFLRRTEHDSLVSTESALGIYALPGLAGEPDPVLVPTDHLGLLVDPRAAAALVDLVRRLVSRRAGGPA